MIMQIGILTWEPSSYYKETDKIWPLMFECLELFCNLHHTKNPLSGPVVIEDDYV